MWPALKIHLTLEEMTLQLVRCEGFRRMYGTMAQVELTCIRIDKSLYVTQQAEEDGRTCRSPQRIGQVIHQIPPGRHREWFGPA